MDAVNNNQQYVLFINALYFLENEKSRDFAQDTRQER